VQSNGDVRVCVPQPPLGSIKQSPLSKTRKRRPESEFDSRVGQR